MYKKILFLLLISINSYAYDISCSLTCSEGSFPIQGDITYAGYEDRSKYWVDPVPVITCASTAIAITEYTYHSQPFSNTKRWNKYYSTITCNSCPSGTVYSEVSYSCEIPPNPCADDEANTDGTPGGCVRCPINSAPSSTDESICECIPPSVLTAYQGQNICVNENIDTDGDGTPDDLDEFPTNPNETNDNDNDGIGDVADTDDDNDGYSDEQEAREGTNPNDSSSNGSVGGGGSGTSPDGGGQNNGEDSFQDCPVGYEPDSDYAVTGNCSPKDSEESDCSHASSLQGYPFQTITSAGQCNTLIRASSGRNGWKDYLPNCEDGDYACYYSDDESVDNNVSNDINSTSFDVVNKLDEIKSVNENMLNGLSTVNDSLLEQTELLGTKLDKVITEGTQNTNKLDDSINNQTDTIDNQTDLLGSKLDSIKSSIDAKDTFPQEMEMLMEFDEVETSSMLSSHNSEITTQFNDFIDGFRSDILSLMTISIPTVPNCGCTDIQLDLELAGHQFNEVVEICSPLDALFDIMRPMLWFTFLVSTLLMYFRKE